MKNSQITPRTALCRLRRACPTGSYCIDTSQWFHAGGKKPESSGYCIWFKFTEFGEMQQTSGSDLAALVSEVITKAPERSAEEIS